MSYLTNFERDYVMGDLKVYREFDSSHFISNAKSAITNKVEAVNMNMKFDYYTSMLEKAIKSFSVIRIDKEAIREFLSQFNDVSKLDSANIVTRDITYNDVTTFKPQYLSQYIEMVQVLIDNVIKGNASSEEITKFMTGVLPEKVERQVVKTTLKYGLTPKDLVKEQNNKMIKADSLYVKTKVLPFVSKYDAIKQETLAEANSVLNAIREAEINVKSMIGAINKIKATGDLGFDKVQMLNQVSYNTFRGIIDVISFVSFMMIRKLNNISSNIIACNKLYTDVSNLYANSSISESAFDQNILPTDTSSLSESLIKGNSDAFTVLANNIYNFHAGVPSATNIEDKVINSDNGIGSPVELDQEEYDQSIYNEIGKAYISISNGLDILAGGEDDYLLLFDDILERSGFKVILEERFQNELKAITDVSVYKSSVDLSSSNGMDHGVYRRMLRELKDYGENMKTIAKIIFETYSKIMILSNRFNNNINGEYTDMETINEIKILLKNIKEQFTNMTEIVAQRFFDRLKSIGNLLTIMETNSDRANDNINNVEEVETSSSIDMAEAAFESVLQEYEEESNLYFRALEAAYYAEKSLALRGVKVIFEADEANTNNPTGNANNTQNTANTNQNENGKVTITNNATTDTSAKASDTQIASDASNFIKDTLNKFRTKIKATANRDSKWIQENKEGLINVKFYNNKGLTILPYTNIATDQIIADISKLKSAVKSMTQQNLQAIQNKDALYQKIFSFITSGIKEDNGSLADQLTKYYKFGNANTETIMVANSNLANFVTTNVIPYCENFSGTYVDKLEKALIDLGTATDSIVNSYTTNTNESNNGPSIKEKSKWVTTAVRFFAGSILNAVYDRKSDYMKYLNNLAPKTPAKPVQPKQEQNNQQANTQQQATN